MADLSLDVSRYIRAPRTTAANAMSLGHQLLQNVPDTPTEAIATAASRVERRVESLTSVFGGVARKAVDSRPVDLRIDRAWGAFERRLGAAEGLSEEVDRADRERAAELHARFFGDGMGFLKVEYIAEHAESQKRLDWIVGAVETDLNRLIGANYVTNVRAAHAAYGEVLGITAPLDAAQEAKIAEPLRALNEAIGKYTTQIIAWYDNLDETAPDYAAKVEAVKKALAPIDKFREGHVATAAEEVKVAPPT